MGRASTQRVRKRARKMVMRSFILSICILKALGKCFRYWSRKIENGWRFFYANLVRAVGL